MSRPLPDWLAGVARWLPGWLPLPPWVPQVASAALLAAGAALAATWYLDREEARLRSRLVPVEIVVAARDLPPGAPLGRRDLVTAQVPREALPGGALVPTAIEALEGRRLLVPLRARDPLLRSVVADVDGPRPLARELAAGRRAVAVPIEPASAVAGFLEPGDRVDVVLVWQEASGESQAVTLLEALPVLAVGDTRQPGHSPTEAATAVLEADPTEAEALLLALDRGRLALVLRATADAGRRADRRAVALAPLVPGYRPPAGPAPSVEVIRGPR